MHDPINMPSVYNPSEWRIGAPSKYGTHNCNLIQTADGEGIASVYGLPLHTDLEEIENDPRWAKGLTNARLIAAAPKMRQALEQIQMLLSYLPNHGSIRDARTIARQTLGIE